MDITWKRAYLRNDLMGLRSGQVVAVRETGIKHQAPEFGATYWIMSIEHGKLYQVAECCEGKRLNRLLSIERQAKDQDLCNKEANKLIAGSMYQGPNRKYITHLIPRRD